jgi:hypothetical protein
MANRAPNARLQDRILLFMEHHEVKTVSGLARELEASRPSVSRAINALKSGGFVSKTDHGWALTDEGEKEARRLRRQLPDQVEKVERNVTRMATWQSQLMKSVQPGWSQAASGWRMPIMKPIQASPVKNAFGMTSQLESIMGKTQALSKPFEGFGGIAKVGSFVDVAKRFSGIADSLRQSPYSGIMGSLRESAQTKPLANFALSPKIGHGFGAAAGIKSDSLGAAGTLAFVSLFQRAVVNDNLFGQIAQQAMRSTYPTINWGTLSKPPVEPSLIHGVTSLYQAPQVLTAVDLLRKTLGAEGYTAARYLTRQDVLKEMLPTLSSGVSAGLGRSLAGLSHESWRSTKGLISSKTVLGLLGSVDPEDIVQGAIPYMDQEGAEVQDIAASQTIEYFGVQVNPEQTLVVAILLWVALSVGEAHAMAMGEKDIAELMAHLRKALGEIAGVYALLEAIKSSRKNSNDD